MPPLKISDFKVNDYLMSQEMKDRIRDLKRRFKKIDDAFLDLFEKRYIVFLEDGVDL